MQIGAVVLIDALGFKGIWRRESPSAVLRRLKSLRQAALNLQGRDGTGVLLNDSGLRHRVRCMSDTIAITVVVKGPNAPRRGLYRAMLSATTLAGSIMRDALSAQPPLLFRGCVAAGEFLAESDFLIGPAIDEAAEGFEKADGPFLWLSKSALEVSRVYSETFLDRLEPTMFIPHNLPLNDGSSVPTSVFTYFGLTQRREDRLIVRRQLLAAFGKGPLSKNVLRKKTNAARFLSKIDRLAVSGSWMKEPVVHRFPDWNDLTSSQKIRLTLAGIRWE
jgi:hypothetical protein